MKMKTNVNRLIGYARVSTEGQDLACQLKRLKKSGCERIFQEKKSGKNIEGRAELRKALAALKHGDMLLATVGDRVARDPLDMLIILNTVRKAGATLWLLDEAFIDKSSETDDLVAYVNGWSSRQQRLKILVNTAAGRERARERGVKFGRKPKLSPRARKIVVERRANGETCACIAKDLGVSESTVLRASAARPPC